MSKSIVFWSLSKHKMLMDCEMQYALNYYLAKRGEYETKPSFLQLAWRLKHLTNVHLVIGNQIHEQIENEIRTLYATGEVLNGTRMKQELNKNIEELYKKAEWGLNPWYKDPTENPMFFEIYYDGKRLKEETKQFIRKKVNDCINGFMNSFTLNEKIYKSNLEVMEAEKYRSFMLDNIKVNLSADMIFFDGDYNEWQVVDWKTGKESTFDPIQLTIYGMYVETTYGADVSNLIVMNEYLGSSKSKYYTVDKSEFEEARMLIKQSAERIRVLEEKLNVQDEDVMYAFTKTENQNVCERCNFKAICLAKDRDRHIDNFLVGIGKKVPIELMREFVYSGMPVDHEIAGFLEESPYETEESYTYRLERLSDYLGRH